MKLRSLIIYAIIIVIALFLINSLFFAPKIKNVLLISIDTCRADHLGCYGYDKKTTPNIDAVAKKGFLFENVISPIPLTLGAHSSMLTGTIPPYHGIHDNLDYSLTESNLTLAEILKEKGFKTGAVISTFVLDSQFGISQGFDYYNDDFEKLFKSMGINERRAEETSRIAMDWIEGHKDEKFFFFLHYFDPHEEYAPPEPFKSKFIGNPYDGEIAYTDKYIGEVIDKLKELGLYDSTLIIITADHGEMLGEHGESSHGFFIYQPAIHVPLVIKHPKYNKPKRVSDAVGLIDIVPTVCELLGIAAPSNIQGKSLIGLFRDQKTTTGERGVFTGSMLPTKYGASPLLGLVENQYKYIQATRPELYDLVEDPYENNNLAAGEPQRTRIMQDRLKLMIEDTLRSDNAESKVKLDALSRQKLESLGYVAGSITEDFQFDQSKIDPKDLVGFYEQNRKMEKLIAQKKFQKAREFCEEMLRMHPDELFLVYQLGKIAFAEGDMQEAIIQFSRFLNSAIKKGKYKEDYVIFDTHHRLAMALAKLGRFQDALDHFNKAMKIDPEEPNLYCNIGHAYAERGSFDNAIEFYSKALALEPSHNNKLIIFDGFAKAYLGKNDSDNAIAYWQKILEIDPRRIDTLNDLGVTLFKNQNPQQAIDYWNKSLQLDPEQADIYKSIGIAYLAQNNIEQAILFWQDSLQINPGQPTLWHQLGRLFYRQGALEKALEQWYKALGLTPNSIELINDIAWSLAVHQDSVIYDPQQALMKAKQACKLTNFNQANFLDTLSVAYAANNNFSRAIETAQKAIDLAESENNQQLASEIQIRLEIYKTGQPYFESHISSD